MSRILDRRRFLTLASAALAAASARVVWADPALTTIRRPLPSRGETLPVIGMGTWITFNVASNETARQAQRQLVLERFFAAGGGMIDSSPMYGSAEWLLGSLLPRVAHDDRLWTATKVWTPFEARGPGQLEESLQLWGAPRFDVVLVHNLLNWRAHLRTLRRAQEDGRVRWIGISTSHGRRHEEVERVIRTERLDVLQITCNLADASAEPLMALAAERGMAVVVNRPLDGGWLFRRVGERPVPGWAQDIGCANWAQFFLKWVVANPAVTCAIPATRNPAHMDENMGAGRAPLPGPALRRRMQTYMDGL